MNSKSLPSKNTTEIIPLSWIFEDPTTSVVNVTVTVTVARGEDALPLAILYAPASVKEGRTVVQVISGGLPGVVYKIVMSATLADGTVYDYTAFLPVVDV